jgi:hypothetical protein
LDFLGFLRPIRGFSKGYGQSKAKIIDLSRIRAPPPPHHAIGVKPQLARTPGASPSMPTFGYGDFS